MLLCPRGRRGGHGEADVSDIGSLRLTSDLMCPLTDYLGRRYCDRRHSASSDIVHEDDDGDVVLRARNKLR